MGSGRALEWCLTGGMIVRRGGPAGGLVTEVVAAEALFDRALELGEKLAAGALDSVRLSGASSTETRTRRISPRCSGAKARALRQAYASPEHHEAVKAFLEKRAPDFAKARLARAGDAMTSVGPAPPAREAYADVPGVRIWYVDTGGSGLPVVFMHAATGSSRVWEHQMPAFTRAGYRVIAHDRRGWGRSVIDPSGPQPGTAADDLQALMDHLGIDRIHLVGTAAGAIASLDFALSFPHRLRSLVVANSIGGVQDEDYLALGRRLRPPQFDALPAEVRELGPSLPGGRSRGHAPLG